MKLVNRELLIKQLILMALLLIFIYTTKVLADESLNLIKFHTYVPAGGGYQTVMDTELKKEVDYVKVVVKGKKGDKYDIKLKYTKDFFKSEKTLAVKKGLIGKKYQKHTIYFIPQKGKCPGKKSECIRVPVIEGISTSTKVIDSVHTLYGIEIYNGSARGLIMEVKGYYSFMNYGDEGKDDTTLQNSYLIRQ